MTLTPQELDDLMQSIEQPLTRLSREIEEHKREHEVRFQAAGKAVNELRHSKDALEQTNEAIDKYAHLLQLHH